ncbi:hypothetical protein ABPG75_009947 [Micractinium tetrahymenae]
MIAAAADATLHCAALASACGEVSLRLLSQTACSAVESGSKGAARCLRSALSLLAGESNASGSDDAACCSPRSTLQGAQHPHLPSPHHHQHSIFDVLSYASAALAALSATVCTAFHEKSYWTAAAMLDIAALFTVWRHHKRAHADAAAAASLRRAAADPGNPSTASVAPDGAELALLQAAAAHGKAAYGAPAAAGDVSSALGYLSLVTLGQATRKAPRNIPPAAHLRAVHQLTGCLPGDVLAAQWVAHLHRPAWYAAIDRQRGMVVVCIRGTLQLGDYATVLDAVPQPATLCGVAGHVHGGFLAAARNMLAPVSTALRAAAQACPGWPVLLCGHSLGGGVAAVLTMLLVEQRQRWELQQQWQQQQQQQGGEAPELEEQQQLEQQRPAAVPPLPLAQQAGQDEMWRQLGELRCVGIGAAAAFCETLGMACKPHVTSVLYGADCLPMFSVLGARLLIEEVHAKSKAAAVVGSLLRRARLPQRRRAGSGSGSSPRSSEAGSPSSAAGDLARTASSASSASSSLACELACGAGGCRGLCCCPADSASELAEVETLPAGLGASLGLGRSRLQRCSSAWSTASTASIAAFASEAAGADRGAALVPMFPPGRILWLLPPTAEAQQEQGAASGARQQLGRQQVPGRQQQDDLPPQLVETDQAAFERFLFTTETVTLHLPDFYIRAIDAVAAQRNR